MILTEKIDGDWGMFSIYYAVTLNDYPLAYFLDLDDAEAFKLGYNLGVTLND